MRILIFAITLIILLPAACPAQNIVQFGATPGMSPNYVSGKGPVQNKATNGMVAGARWRYMHFARDREIIELSYPGINNTFSMHIFPVQVGVRVQFIN